MMLVNLVDLMIVLIKEAQQLIVQCLEVEFQVIRILRTLCMIRKRVVLLRTDKKEHQK